MFIIAISPNDVRVSSKLANTSRMGFFSNILKFIDLLRWYKCHGTKNTRISRVKTIPQSILFTTSTQPIGMAVDQIVWAQWAPWPFSLWLYEGL